MPLHVGALLLQVSLSVSVFRGGGGRGVTGGGTFRLLSLLWQYPVLVFTKSVNSNFCAFGLAPVTLYPWLFTVLQPEPKWHLVSRHVRKDEI